jgi:hypothetical protein
MESADPSLALLQRFEREEKGVRNHCFSWAENTGKLTVYPVQPVGLWQYPLQTRVTTLT